jgi:trk system potassium uptake protein TrkH
VEARTFIVFVILIAVLVSLCLLLTDYYANPYDSMENAIFEVVSVVTSTGFGVDDFSAWPLFLPSLLITISFVGGCGGSTAGGMKVIRILTLVRLSYREIVRLIHPRVIFPESIGVGQPVSPRVAESIFGFFSVYVGSFVLLMLFMMASGADQITAFSAIATCMNNLGPGLGEVTQSFSSVNDPGKLISVLAMLLGRLELLSVLVLLHPDFWNS